MPQHDPDPEDPLILVGAMLPVPDEQAQREMVGTFSEEFARLGYDAGQIFALFRKPYYAATHGAMAGLGEEEVRRISDETVAVWGRVRWTDREAAPLLTIGAGDERPSAGVPSDRRWSGECEE